MSDGITDGIRAQSLSNQLDKERQEWLRSSPEQYKTIEIVLTHRELKIILDRTTPRGLQQYYDRMLSIEHKPSMQELIELSNKIDMVIENLKVKQNEISSNTTTSMVYNMPHMV